VEVGLDGSLTLIAAYPNGETDIDGLAISDDGRAFLITDAPGDIYVYDFNTMTYTAPISNPWTSSENFSGGAWVTDESPEAELSPESLSETIGENGQSSRTITISNTGTADLAWSIEEATADCDTPADIPWLSVAPPIGTTAGGNNATIDVNFDATALEEGDYTGFVCVGTNDPDEPMTSISVTLTIISNQIRIPIIMGSPQGNP
jgi:hypothetical protein